MLGASGGLGGLGEGTPFKRGSYAWGPKIWEGPCFLLCLREGKDPRSHSCVACLEALPKIPLPSKAQEKQSCCIPRDLRGPGQWAGASAATVCCWAPFKLLTLLGGMLRERKKIQGVTDVEFPTSMVRWGLKGQNQVHGNGISACLNLSTAFHTHL